MSIDRFETAGKLIGYYGVFPEEWQSGVDKFGNPVPTGKKIMCREVNDLVRGLLWQCAKCASAENGGNPAVRALYLRRLASGDTPQVAWGYCMTKLLRCFDSTCRAQGNVLEFWMAYRQLPLYEAAEDLARTLHMELPTNDKHTPKTNKTKGQQTAGITPPSP